MPHVLVHEDRLDAWSDGNAVCLIAIGSHNDPLDLSEQEVENLIVRLQQCLTELRSAKAG